MSKTAINNIEYEIHPVYDLYGADENGNILNIVIKIPYKGYKNKFGYVTCTVNKHGQKGQKSIQAHRFIWECHNGLIPDG